MSHTLRDPKGRLARPLYRMGVYVNSCCDRWFLAGNASDRRQKVKDEREEPKLACFLAFVLNLERILSHGPH